MDPELRADLEKLKATLANCATKDDLVRITPWAVLIGVVVFVVTLAGMAWLLSALTPVLDRLFPL